MPAPTLLILPGDGIGPEVMAEVRKVVDWFGRNGRPFEVEEDLVGGCAYDAHGAAISDATMAKAQAADAVLLAAVGGPKWDKVPYDVRPEAGLLRLRKDLELFANLRPAKCFDALADFSSLKRELVEGLDILIVRELTGGVYFGEPKTITDLGNGQKRAIDTQVYDSFEIERIAAVAFELARVRAQPRLLDGEAQRDEVGRPLERGRHRHPQGALPGRRAQPHARRRRRHAARPRPEAVRRHRHRQPVRRHALRRRRDADRLARHAALRLARRARPEDRPPQGALRARPRLGPRHRRPGQGQPDRLHPLLRHGAALLLRRRRRGRPPRGRRRDGARRRPAHRRPRRPGRRQRRSRPPAMGDAIVAALDA